MATNQALERKLWSFAEESIKPSEQSLKKAAAVIDKLVAVIQSSSNYTIARIIKAGSYGKSTSLSQHFDIDLVVFVNGQGPPFGRVLQDFEDAIDLAEGFNASEEVKQTSHSIQFKLDGLEIDILPAKNYTEGLNLQVLDDEEVKQQKILALADIQSKYDHTGKYDSSFSSALAESQVDFIKDQSSFVHSLIRLCKFWMKTLQLDYIFGKSFMIELMATKVGQNEENNRHKPSMTKGFLAFLDSMIHFSKIFIDFNPDGRTPNKTKERPVIMDPTNPYNNIASNIEKSTILKLIDYAKETRKRVIFWEESSFLADFMPLEVLFDPQPRVAQPSRGISVPLVDIGEAVKHYHPKMVVNKDKFDKRELEDLKRRVEQSIVTKIQAMTAGAKPGTSCLDVLNMVTNQVDRQVRGVEEQRWSGSSEKHEDYDVTFILPFSIEGCPMSCWVSFKK